MVHHCFSSYNEGGIEIISLNLSELHFILQPKSNIILPRFKEATFRGAFGKMFRRLVCASPQQEKCSNCILFKKCAFSIIFSPGATEGDSYLKKFESIPRPFMVRIENKNNAISPQEELKVCLNLVGKGMEYFPYIFLTIKEMGAEGFGIRNEDGIRGKFEIKKIVETFPDQSKKIIYDCENPAICLPLQGFDLKDIARDEGDKEGKMYCAIKFETPVRLKKDGKIVQFIDFRLLIRSIITRLNALVYFYGNRNIMANLIELLEEAEKVNVARCNTRFVDFKWHSGRQKTNIMLGGLVGEMGYQGNIAPFYPYLKIAEITGVGKNTTFGFGRIKVEI